VVRTPNLAVRWVVGGAILFLTLILNIPFLKSLFRFGNISWQNILLCILAGILTVTWFELYKLLKIRKNQPL
jgi:Ca2+-transporting ATPase